VERAVNKSQRLSFTDVIRKRYGRILDPVGAFFNRLGIMPNTMTVLGLIGNTVGAYFLAVGNFTVGGLLILLMGPVDALDGTMARLRGEPTAFGAFVDSVTDRYSELVIFAGIIFYYLQRGDWLMAGVTYAAASGSVLISYIRARAQSLGYETKVGILTRFERYLVLAPSLVVGWPQVGLWVIAIIGNFTALQRILDVRRQARSQSKK
jgi:CDP-diacylglycerol--glycerol-3-phosphate 3-phosphatidyltransferase